jgi:glycerol-3-phosphate dehydrogenase (NAD(P)+)
MKQQLNVSFIGAGEIGAALAKLVAHSGVHVEQWDADPKKVKGQKSLEEVVSMADVLFICVPSWILRLAVKPIVPVLKKKTICVFVSKGIEAKTKLFIDGLAKDMLPKGQPFVLLSGPMLAEELVAGRGGAACVATKSVADYKKIESVFSCDDLHLTHAENVKSVAVAGVLKNVYAIALGISAGLSWGDNRKGWLVTESLHEMIYIMKALKADPSYALCQAGLGDYIATGMSKYSSNQSLGRELVEKTHCDRKSEGCEALPSLVKMLGAKNMKSLPILSALHEVIEKGKNTKDLFEKTFCA